MEQRGFLLLLRLIKHHHFGVATRVCYLLDPRVLLSYVKASSAIYRFLEHNNRAALKQMHAMAGTPMPSTLLGKLNHLRWWHSIYATKVLPAQVRGRNATTVMFDKSDDINESPYCPPTSGFVLQMYEGTHYEHSWDITERMYAYLKSHKLRDSSIHSISITVRARKYMFDSIVHRNCGLDPKLFKRVRVTDVVRALQWTRDDGAIVRRSFTRHAMAIQFPDAPTDTASYDACITLVAGAWVSLRSAAAVVATAYGGPPEMGFFQYTLHNPPHQEDNAPNILEINVWA